MAAAASADDRLYAELAMLNQHLASLQLTNTFLSDRIEVERRRVNEVMSPLGTSVGSSTGEADLSKSAGKRRGNCRDSDDDDDESHGSSMRSAPSLRSDPSMNSQSGFARREEADDDLDEESSRFRPHFRSPPTYVVECSEGAYDDDEEEEGEEDDEALREMSAGEAANITYRSCNLDLVDDEDDLLAAFEEGASVTSKPAIAVDSLAEVVIAFARLAQEGAAADKGAVEAALGRLEAVLTLAPTKAA